jgi:2-hydroxychromene-2-carboxylate isomerase
MVACSAKLGSPAPLKQRAAAAGVSLGRIGALGPYLGLPINKQPAFFPVSGDLASKWILAASNRGAADALKLTGAILTAVWAEERNIADGGTLAAIALEQSLDADVLAAGAATPDTTARYAALTQEAIGRQLSRPHPCLPRRTFWGRSTDFWTGTTAKRCFPAAHRDLPKSVAGAAAADRGFDEILAVAKLRIKDLRFSDASDLPG